MSTKAYLVEWAFRTLSIETDECIPFARPVKDRAYGQIRYRGKNYPINAWICEQVYGPRPEGLVACHSCGNSWCCNKRHLRWDTRSANMKDRWKHGTQGNWWTIRPEDHDFIKGSSLSNKELADMYGVYPAAIWRIRNLKQNS